MGKLQRLRAKRATPTPPTTQGRSKSKDWKDDLQGILVGMQKPFLLKIVCTDTRHKRAHTLGGFVVDLCSDRDPVLIEHLGKRRRSAGEHMPLVDRPIPADLSKDGDVIPDKKRGVVYRPTYSAYRIYCDSCGRDARLAEGDLIRLLHGFGEEHLRGGGEDMCKLDLVDLSKFQSDRDPSRDRLQWPYL